MVQPAANVPVSIDLHSIGVFVVLGRGRRTSFVEPVFAFLLFSLFTCFSSFLHVLTKIIKANETGSTDRTLPPLLGVMNSSVHTVTALVGISAKGFSAAQFAEVPCLCSFALRIFSFRSVHLFTKSEESTRYRAEELTLHVEHLSYFLLINPS